MRVYPTIGGVTLVDSRLAIQAESDESLILLFLTVKKVLNSFIFPWQLNTVGGYINLVVDKATSNNKAFFFNRLLIGNRRPRHPWPER